MPSTGSRSWRCADRPDRAAVRERLVHGEVEARRRPPPSRPVERAAAVRSLAARPHAGQRTPAGRRLPGRAAARRAPSEAASSVCSQPEAARPFRPASSRQRSTTSASSFAAPLSSTGVDRLEQLRPGRRAPRQSSSRRRASRASFESASTRTPPASPPSRRARSSASWSRRTLPIELLARRSFRCSCDELLDVPLVARLRPAALVVLPGRLVVVLGDLLEPARAQAVELSPRSRPTTATIAPSPRPTSGTSGAR